MSFRLHGKWLTAFLFAAGCAGPVERLPRLPPPDPTLVAAPAPPSRVWPADLPAAPLSPAATYVLNQEHTAVLGPMSPRPTTFENSCAPEPYIFQSNAGYEAVRVKDCRHDQLLYLPASETARIGRFIEECRLICSGQSGQRGGL